MRPAADGWRGITTESLRWDEADYDRHAGLIELRATREPDSTPHLFFVDLRVQTNASTEPVTLSRIEGGKLLSILLDAQADAQAGKDRPVIYRAIPERAMPDYPTD
jgi:hypothetical protein